MYIDYCFNIFIWLLLIVLNLNVLVPSFPKVTNSYKMFFILVVMFATFGFITGDYFHYQEIFDSYAKYQELEHVEPIYLSVAKFVGGNYTLWRLVVWTVATLLYIFVMRQLKVTPSVASLCFALFTMFYFCSHRQTVAFCVVFLSICLFLSNSKSKLLKIIAIAIFIASIFFHRSMVVYAFLFLLSLIPLNRYAYIVIICLYPLVSYLFSGVIGYASEGLILDETLTENYINSDMRVNTTIWGVVSNLITLTPIYILLLLAIYKTKFQAQKLPYVANVFLQMSFWQIYLSALFQNQDVSSFLAPRFREDSLMTLGIFYSVYLSTYTPTRKIKLFLWWLFVANMYIYLYALYKI